MKFMERVATFMQRYDYTASQFGRAVLNDSGFVFRLQKGRQVTERTMDKVDAWMASHEHLDIRIQRLRAQRMSWRAIGKTLDLPSGKIRERARALNLIPPRK